MEENKIFNVILTRQEDADSGSLIDVFGKHYGLIHYEAEQAVRRSRGFIFSKISKQEAEGLSKLCRDAGVETMVIPDNLIAVLPVAVSCTGMDLTADALRYTLENHEAGSVTWDRVTIISSGSVTEEKTNLTKQKESPSAVDQVTKGIGLLTIGIPITFGRKKEELKETRENIQVIYLELFLKDAPYRLKINADNFNYAYLGKRKQYASVINFHAMLEDINSYAVKAMKNTGFTKMLSKEKLYRQGYDTYRDFEKELKWLATLDNLQNK